MGEVRSVIPIEETIIDPLYEPLKLNRYELCEHLQWLKDISHLRYGFSPYLLFDVAGMTEVVGIIKKDAEFKESIDEFSVVYDDFTVMFEKYLRLLKEYVAWDRGQQKFIKVGRKELSGRNDIYRELRESKDEILKKHKNTKEEYRKILGQFLYTSNKFDADNYKKIAYLFRLEYPVRVKCPLCKKEVAKQLMCEEGKIYSMKEALLRTFEFRRARWLYLSGMLHYFHKASTHTRLSHQIGCLIVAVNALREIDVYPSGDFSMSFGEYLLMRGEMYEFLVANLLHDLGHPPLSHVLEVSPFVELDHEEITSNLILGEKTEEEKMDWYVAERYLLKMKAIKEFEYRFFENRYDPIYDIPEEKIIKNLKRYLLFTIELKEELDKDNQSVSKKLKEEFKKAGFPLSNSPSKNKINNNEWGIIDEKRKYIIIIEEEGKLSVYKEPKSKEEIFLDYLVKNNEILESEIITVSEVLENFGVDNKRVVEILSGKVFCPKCKKFSKIEELNKGYSYNRGVVEEEAWCIEKNHEQDIKKIHDIHFLNKLMDSGIDFDRIDHVKRDSDICGLSLTSFRLLELLGSISVILPDSNVRKEVWEKDATILKNGPVYYVGKILKPYIFISEDGLKYVMDLLNARRLIFNEVLYSDENNWINGVVNQLTALTLRYLPHLKNMLPFITDPILAHFYMNDLFLGTQIEKLNKLFHGKIDYSVYIEEA